MTYDDTQEGGALLATGSSSANLTDVYLMSNTANFYGGAVTVLDGSSLVLKDSYVGANTAVTRGGGVHLDGAVGEFEGVTFVENSASGGR